jgi:hypothetical protein
MSWRVLADCMRWPLSSSEMSSSVGVPDLIGRDEEGAQR